MMRPRTTRRPFTIHIQNETTGGPRTAGTLCGQPRRPVIAAAHPGRSALVCPACAARWRELMKQAMND